MKVYEIQEGEKATSEVRVLLYRIRDGKIIDVSDTSKLSLGEQREINDRRWKLIRKTLTGPQISELDAGNLLIDHATGNFRFSSGKRFYDKRPIPQ